MPPRWGGGRARCLWASVDSLLQPGAISVVGGGDRIFGSDVDSMIGTADFSMSAARVAARWQCSSNRLQLGRKSMPLFAAL